MKTILATVALGTALSANVMAQDIDTWAQENCYWDHYKEVAVENNYLSFDEEMYDVD